MKIQTEPFIYQYYYQTLTLETNNHNANKPSANGN